eukprot:273828-Rhodomonas_salina.4
MQQRSSSSSFVLMQQTKRKICARCAISFVAECTKQEEAAGAFSFVAGCTKQEEAAGNTAAKQHQT